METAKLVFSPLGDFLFDYNIDINPGKNEKQMQYVTALRAPASSEMFKETGRKYENKMLSLRFIMLRDQRFVCILILRSAEPEITQLRND